METFQLPSGRSISFEFTYKSEPGRPTILLSNSLASQFHFWDDVVAKLHESGFRIIRYDHPGHGQSGVPSDLGSTTFNSLAEDVHALLNSAAVKPSLVGSGAPSPTAPLLHGWIGDSMGAALGIVFSSAHPGLVRNLVVCDTIACSPANAGVSPDPFAARVEAVRSAGSMDAAVEETMGRWFGGDWIAANAGEAGRVRGLMRTTTPDGFETCVAALRSETFDLRPLLPKMAGCVESVLFVVGAKDADLPEKMEGMRAEVQKGFDAEGRRFKVELRVIPNAGHVPFIDGYDDFIKTVLPFLKQK
jgi:pimeloyl-ACP methyl ester carboxylesterase